MKLKKSSAMMPDSQDKSPIQGESPKQSVVEVLKSVVIRKRAKREEEEAKRRHEQALSLVLPQSNKDTSGGVLAGGLSSIEQVTSKTAQPVKPLVIEPITTPDQVPRKRPRRAPDWEDNPQLVNLSLPALPVLPPIETFNILSSVQGKDWGLETSTDDL